MHNCGTIDPSLSFSSVFARVRGPRRLVACRVVRRERIDIITTTLGSGEVPGKVIVKSVFGYVCIEVIGVQWRALLVSHHPASTRA